MIIFSLDCSLEVQKGTITGLIGQNGAGKSTTFKAALGLIPFDSGKITLLGKDSKELTPKREGKVRCCFIRFWLQRLFKD